MNILASILSMICMPAAAQQASHAAQSVSTPTFSVDQLYAPSSLRDPLLPAMVFGDTASGKAAAKAAAEVRQTSARPQDSGVAQSAVLPVAGLTITGLMEDYGGRQALLKDAATGALYTLRAGRLYDSRKKAVPGVSGVVKGRQVVLMTEDGKVTQLSLPEKE